MLIRKIDPSIFGASDTTHRQELFPSEDSGATPFRATWHRLAPGEARPRHRHQERESIIVAQGRAQVRLEDDSATLEVGDAVLLEPGVQHTLANASDAEPLCFLEVSWDSLQPLLAEPEQPAPARYLAYPSPPTPNGDLHLGHLSGPVLGADLFIRHRRMRGDDAYYVIGTDDNQMWTAAMAEQRGTTPQETADHFADRIEGTMAKAGIGCHHYFRPNATSLNADLLKELSDALWAEGKLVAKDAPALVCEGCGGDDGDFYLFEVRVAGGCPHCRSATYGNGCEECGLPNQVSDLIDPKCRGCGKTPVEKPLRRLYFPLEPHREFLESYLQRVVMTAQHRALVSRMMASPLPDVVASHPGSWGIPVELGGIENQCYSAWLEMLPGYLAAAEELADKEGLEGGWKAFWGPGSPAQVVQFFGYDNCWNHGVLYPALLHAWDPSATAPVGFVANELYRLDNSKFSTSRNHAVWTREIVDLNGPDTVRFYAAHTCPEAEQTNYSLTEFADFVAGELIGGWQGWLSELQGRVDRGSEGRAPVAGTRTERQQAFHRRLQGLVDEAGEAYAWQTFSPQRVTRLCCELVRSARDFGGAENAWSRVPGGTEEHHSALALELSAVRVLAMLVKPVMPDFAAHLEGCLGLEALRWDAEPQNVTPGTTIAGLDRAYFPKPVIEDSATVAA